MKRMFVGLSEVFKRELGIIIKDFDLIVILLLAPILYGLFYGTIYINKSEMEVPVVAVLEDNSNVARELLISLNSTQLIKVNEIVYDFETAKDRLYNLDAQAIIYFSDNFEKDLKAGKGTDIKIYLNNTKFLSSNDINKAFNEVLGTLSAGIKLRYFQSQGYSFDQSKELIEPIQTDVRSLFNTTESYGDFFLPVLLALILQQTLLIGLAESISKEREEKTINQLYKTASKNIFVMINGKSFIYLVMFSSYALFFYAVIFNLFSLNMLGSIFALALLTIIFFLTIIYLSVLVASFFERKIISLQFFAFTSIPVFLLSGVPWPIETMPWLIQQITKLVPTSPYFLAMQRITQMGAGFHEIIPELLHLIILMVVFHFVAYMRLNALVKKEVY